MYLEKKHIGGRKYNYLKVSARQGDKVRTRTVAYIGKGSLTKGMLKKELSLYKRKAEIVKSDLLEELKIEAKSRAEYFLAKEKLTKAEEIKNAFNKKLKEMDEKTKEDMLNDFLILYAYNTNAIEGNTFTLRDTELLLNKGITPQGKNLREINDHLNAKEAFNSILTKNMIISHENIIRLHTILMKNIDERTGFYRTHNVRVFGAAFETSPAEYVKADMDMMLKWHRKNKARTHPLILAAAFHHKFERIHPFYDGNGRTGRLLLNAILWQNKYPPLIIPTAQRKRYYAALSSADKTELGKLQPQHKDIVTLCYFSMLKTYNTVFGRWGSNP